MWRNLFLAALLSSVPTMALPDGPLMTKELIWFPGGSFSGAPLTFPLGATIRSLSCRVATPAGIVATFTVVKAPSNALANGTEISMPCNANGAPAANQNLLSAVQPVSAGDIIGIAATNWTGSKGVGTLTVGYSVP